VAFYWWLFHLACFFAGLRTNRVMIATVDRYDDEFVNSISRYRIWHQITSLLIYFATDDLFVGYQAAISLVSSEANK
jgi:hypothetical protein